MVFSDHPDPIETTELHAVDALIRLLLAGINIRIIVEIFL